MTQYDPGELARAFIADQENAERSGSQPGFWSMNHYRIKPIAHRLATLLRPEERTTFYEYYMQRSGGFPSVRDREIPLLIEAYRRLLPGMDELRPNHMERRYVSLYIFGFDEAGELPDGVLGNAQELKTRLTTITQAERYTNMPAQRAKKERFRPFAGEAPRLLQMLRHLDYIHDRQLSEAHFRLIDLTLWGMILIILLNPETRSELIRDVLYGAPDLPRRLEYLGLLNEYARVVVDEAGAEETEFRELVTKLAASQMS